MRRVEHGDPSVQLDTICAVAEAVGIDEDAYHVLSLAAGGTAGIAMTLGFLILLVVIGAMMGTFLEFLGAVLRQIAPYS